MLGSTEKKLLLFLLEEDKFASCNRQIRKFSGGRFERNQMIVTMYSRKQYHFRSYASSGRAKQLHWRIAGHFLGSTVYSITTLLTFQIHTIFLPHM